MSIVVLIPIFIIVVIIGLIYRKRYNFYFVIKLNCISISFIQFCIVLLLEFLFEVSFSYYKPNVISTRKLFGSSIKFNMKASDASKYFEILPFQMKGDGSLNFKTGDILGLEASYGQFLTMLYREVSQ